MRRDTRFALMQVLILLLFISSSFSQYKKRVDGEAIKSIIAAISSDSYQGRETGTNFGEQTEEYFAKEYQKAGLKPAGDKNSFFYTYYLTKEPVRKVEGTPALVVENRIFYYGRDDDFREAQFTEGGDVSGEVVYVDYGIYNPEQKRNDYENINLKGKIALVKRGCPNDDWGKWKLSATDSAKAEYCYKQGAVGMLIFEPVNQTQTQIMNLLNIPNPNANIKNSLSEKNPIRNFPVLMVDQRVARFLDVQISNRLSMFGGGREARSESKPTGKKAQISLKINVQAPVKARDVLAMIPGTDSKLKNEAVIIGGHLDHLGVNSKGEVFNGADDNASGPSVALGVAQAMIKNKFKPKRTVIFAGWSGEEKGLLGSKAWCENPTWDLNKVVVYFNLDMVGLGSDTLDFPGIYYAEDVWKFIKENSQQDYLSRINPSKGGPGGSDHSHFLYNGVPAFAGMTGGLQRHPDYHQTGDDPEKISASLLQFVGDWMYHCIDLLSGTNQNLISPKRNSNVKYLMANVINSAPIKFSDLKNAKEDRNLTTVLVNLSEGMDQNNTDKNLISILRNLDEFNKQNPSNPMQVTRRRGGPRGSQFQSFVNFNTIGYDEVFCKTLAKSGAKIGCIGSDIASKINNLSENFLTDLINAGMVVILNDLSKENLSKFVSQVEKPLAVQSSDPNILTDELTDKINSKGHLFIYKFSGNIPASEIVKNIEVLKNKIDAKNIFASPDITGKAGFDKIKEVFIALDEKYPKEEFVKNMFSANYSTFVAKITPQQNQPQQIRTR